MKTFSSAPKQTPLFVKILKGKRNILVKDLIPTFNRNTNQWHPPALSPKRQSALRKLATMYHVTIPGIYEAPSYQQLLQNTPENLLKRLNQRTTFNFFKTALPDLQNNPNNPNYHPQYSVNLLNLAKSILATEPIEPELKYLQKQKASRSSSIKKQVIESKSVNLAKEEKCSSAVPRTRVDSLNQIQPAISRQAMKEQAESDQDTGSLENSSDALHYSSMYTSVDGLENMSSDDARKLAVLERKQLRYPLRLPGRRKLSKSVKVRVKRQVLAKESLVKMPAMIAAYREERRKLREATKPKYPY